MADLMYTIESPSGPPSLSDAAQQLHVDRDDLDASFGVVLIDPKKHLYTVLVHENAIDNVRASDDSAEGPFSNPRIGTFGPVQSDSDR